MLQPRVRLSSERIKWQTRNGGIFFIIILLISSTKINAQYTNLNDEILSIVEPTPALKLNGQDVTTVLLVDNNNNRAPHGRFLNVRPEVGILTSTARTFIQEGITTEFATEVLGTTLDHGRLYAQVLTKSSRVFYDREPSINNYNNDYNSLASPASVKTSIVYNTKNANHINDIADNQPYWYIDDDNDGGNSFNERYIKNTDYIQPTHSIVNGAYLVFPTKSVPANPLTNRTGKNVILLNNQHNRPEALNLVHESFSISQSSSSSSSSSSGSGNDGAAGGVKSGKNLNVHANVSPDKVQNAAAFNLPTYTIKNEFSPSGFSLDDPYNGNHYDESVSKSSQSSSSSSSSSSNNGKDFRNNKMLFRGNVLKQDTVALSSVTYYGFSDFTTIVGDTVIIFSPSTKENPSLNDGLVTSIKGDATLNNVVSTVKTFLSYEPGMVTETVTGHSLDMMTSLPTFLIDPISSLAGRQRKDDKDNEEDGAEEEVTEQVTKNYETIDETTTEDLASNEIQTPESVITIPTEKPVLRKPTLADIEAILNQGKKVATLTPDAIQPSEMMSNVPPLSIPSNEDISKIFESISNSKAAKTKSSDVPTTVTEVDQETHVLGGVTTIFFEDPFLPTPTLTVRQGASDIVQDNEESASTTTENDEIMTTTDNNSADTESDDGKKELEPCQNPTPAVIYRTYTYLTTFLIPVDDTSTSSSIKSNEVVSTELSDSTVCQPAEIIKPTPVDELESASSTSIRNVLEKPQSQSQSIKSLTDDDSNEEVDKIAENLLSITTTEIIDHGKDNGNDDEEEEEEEEEKEKEEEDEDEQTTSSSSSSIAKTTTESIDNTTPILEIVTEKKHVTTSYDNDNQDDDDDDDDGDGDNADDNDDKNVNLKTIVNSTLSSNLNVNDEFELIYKTLYTTYTYLTTFFHESTSSVSSRKDVVTNIVTSTLNKNLLKTDNDVANLLSSMSNNEFDIKPTSVGIGRPTSLFTIQDNDLSSIDDILEASEKEKNLHQETSSLILHKDRLKNGDIKTYYTTYTYFTTIFVDGETEVSSRTQVYTNYVTPTVAVQDIQSTKMVELNSDQVIEEDNRRETNEEDNVGDDIFIHIKPSSLSYNSTINRDNLNTKISNSDHNDENDDVVSNNNKYSTMVRGNSNPDDEPLITMVTDVKSSSSNGDRKIIENSQLEDQISSESNKEEILPSPTLLLQTSYTTFTYFTTMYVGSTSSNVLSRLETVTNVVTETLKPTRPLQHDDNLNTDDNDATLPITYFTTFTYWTTLFKDGSTTTTSREETISNVVTPTITVANDLVLTTTKLATLDHVDARFDGTEKNDDSLSIIKATPILASHEIQTVNEMTEILEPTTYYTTYTYFTTSYIGNETILKSRFETETSVVTAPSKQQTGRAFNLNGNVNQLENEGDIKTKLVEQIGNTATIAASTLPPTAAVNIQPTGVVSLNQGKIIDADGVSTIFFTTKAIGSYIDKLYAQVIESTSSVKVDEEKKSALATAIDPSAITASTRTLRTGLVRLIEGTIISNRTTTVYQSKVIGTLIDGRYAQIIESTSSFIIEKTHASILVPGAVGNTLVTPTNTFNVLSTASPNQLSVNPAPTVVESSISDSTIHDHDHDGDRQDENDQDGEDEEEDDEEDDGTGRVKSRLRFSTRKRTFTPVIRPFASRNRPTFNPKRKTVSPSSATTITRSDITPTITATPALKSEASKGRFSNNRRGSVAVTGQNLASSGTQQLNSGSSSRRFSRPRNGGLASSSIGGNINLSTSSRIRPTSLSGRLQPTSSNIFGSSSRRGGILRTSPVNGGGGIRTSGLSSIYSGSSSRFRGIRPTQTQAGSPVSTSYTTNVNDINEEDSTSLPDDENEENQTVPPTTENSRRNPLLRFRRPLISNNNNKNNNNNNNNNNNGRSPNPAITTPRPTIATRRSSILSRSKATTPATTTTTTQRPRGRPFQRPQINYNATNRTRGNSNLFPPRGFFRPTEIAQNLDEEADKTENGTEDNENEEIDAENSNNFDDGVFDTTEEANRENRALIPQPKIAAFRKRTKRQAEYGSRGTYTPRYRLQASPRTTTTTQESVEEIEQPRNRPTGRYQPRGRTTAATSRYQQPQQSTANRIKPTPTNQNRAQFTLREKDTLATKPRTNFRRPTVPSAPVTRRKPATTTRSRLRSYSSGATTETYNTHSSGNTRPRTTNSRRPTTRSRGRTTESFDYSYVQPSFDGTITVTHHIPTEITISSVNGKITEYKNVVTAKISTEILGPKQYSTTALRDGSPILILTSEQVNVNSNGVTELTQFVLRETPTTSVIFTPTTIRGRRTSFSHVIPSTVYEVENVVSTVRPQIDANAPLANILLSQLLLGNLGLPQQNINPLLVGQQQGQVMPGTPTTEYKTRTTTYVTTVANAMSTVLSLTFHGKPILTTIYDSSANVITATEFITDTIVVTPTAVQQPQINSLLLPLLLQQQQQQQQQQNLLAGQQNILQNTQLLGNQQSFFQQNDKTEQLEPVVSSNSRLQKIDSDGSHDSEEYLDQETFDDVAPVVKPRVSKARVNKKPRIKADPPLPPKETSVITLYVSGRRPGDFSTVLSTVVVGEDSTIRKRAANNYQPMSELPFHNNDGGDLLAAASDESVAEFILPSATNEISIGGDTVPYSLETERLESIIGDVSKKGILYGVATESVDPVETKYVAATTNVQENFLI